MSKLFWDKKIDFKTYSIALQATNKCLDQLESDLVGVLDRKIKLGHPLYDQKRKMEDDIRVGVEHLRVIASYQLYHIFKVGSASNMPQHYANIV